MSHCMGIDYLVSADFLHTCTTLYMATLTVHLSTTHLCMTAEVLVVYNSYYFTVSTFTSQAAAPYNGLSMHDLWRSFLASLRLMISRIFLTLSDLSYTMIACRSGVMCT